MLCAWGALVLSTFALFSFTFAQTVNPMGGWPQSSWPQVYPGVPAGNYSPEWQNYFQVTEPLPNVTWPLPRNWAGNIGVQRPGHPNDTLFFWAFESSEGSFTENSTKPWSIWLNGGPGGSSLVGLLFENGPLQVMSNYSVAENPYAWTTIADMVWIDNPVAVGFSTADTDGYAASSDQMAADLMGFLDNLIKVFPNLATRPLILAGESYAGTYISYIAKHYFEMDKPPVKLSALAIGDGLLGSYQSTIELGVTSVLETYPQLIGYDAEVFKYFQEQSALCGYNITLQYPQPAHFPTLNSPLPFESSGTPLPQYSAKFTKRLLVQDKFVKRLQERGGYQLEQDERLRARNAWKRDLSGRANGTIDPWYQCDLSSEMNDYALNFTYPWSSGHGLDPYDIPNALSPEVPLDASVFLNDAQTRAALHAPTSKNWAEIISVTFAPTNGSTNPWGDPSIEPMVFLSELATNATAHNVSIVIYSGNDDSVVPHFASQVAIQNTTFGGINGFTRKPETPWYKDDGEFGGIVHQERGWKYVLVDHAGHFLAYSNPASGLVLAREFIFGDNPRGLVTTTDSGSTTVIGGEVASLGGEIMTGQAGIYVGSATTASTYFFPSATVEAWDSYIATATATSTPGV